ncbi:MAG: hypothetical protein ABIJ45_11870 [Candidatus Zixiibacteriota bacterium]
MKKLLIVIACLLLAAPAYSLTGLSVGFKGGLASNAELGGLTTTGSDNVDELTMAGGQVKFTKLPFVDVIGSVEYGWKTLETASIGGYEGELKFKDLAFTASAVYPVKVKFIKFYGGFGLDMHSFGYDFSVNGVPISASTLDGLPEDETVTGYHLLGGFDISLPAFPMGVTAEVRQNWLNTDATSKYFQMTMGLIIYF